MKISGKKRPTVEIPLWTGAIDGEPQEIVATVGYLTRPDEAAAFQAGIGAAWDDELNDGKGGVRQTYDERAVIREKLRRAVIDVRGLTVENFAAFADIVDDIEIDVRVADDGRSIVWDHDHVVRTEVVQVPAPTAKDPDRKKTKEVPWNLATFLYAYAPSENFSTKIDQAQKDFRQAESDAEKKRPTTSSDSRD